MPKPLKAATILPFPAPAGAGQKAPSDNEQKLIKKARYAFHNAKQRCTNPKKPEYGHYGGAGIKFLFGSFAELTADIGLPPSMSVSLDRLDSHGHYEPGNVRWASKHAQEANKKKSSGGALPTVEQLVNKYELMAQQPQRREKNTVGWKRCIAAINRGHFTEDDIGAFRWAGLHSEQFDAGWTFGQIRDYAEEPSFFNLPSLTSPGKAIRLRGGPFEPSGKHHEATGLIGLRATPLAFNLPKEVLDWINQDIKSGPKSGSCWVGQASPSILQAGGVEGWMLACAARGPEGTTSAFYPAASLARRIDEMSFDLKSGGTPMTDATFLYVPDLQVDAEQGFDLAPLQLTKIGSLIALRREQGRKTFVGIQNPHKLPEKVRAEVFGHLKVRDLEKIAAPLFPAPAPKSTGPMSKLKLGQLDFKDVVEALEEHVAGL